MKKILALMLLTTPMFAEISSVERPSLYNTKDDQLEILGNIAHKIGDLNNQLAFFKASFLEQQRTNEVLNALNDNIGVLITEVQQSNEYLEHILWNQSHKITELAPTKKTP